MNGLLWALQVLLGAYFVGVGIFHFTLPEGLPEAMSWMYDLSPTVHALAGTAEILGGLGLVLPSVTRIRPELSVAAALGLGVVMVLAAGWHLTRGEYLQILLNLIDLGLLAFVAYGRARLRPIPAR